MDYEFNQEFNYHTHTYRSGHSEYASDEEILEAAKQAGISMIGFSEHVPNSNLELPDEDHRMMLSEVDGYIESINKMKQNNPNMTILAGFEAEFDPMKEAFLGEMREKVDYMVLGQHFVKDGMQMVPQKGNPNYPLEYAEMVCKGIDSGLFDIVAHPDHFISLRDTISDDNRSLYEENCIKASHMICQKAAEMGIPLEINLSPALNDQILHDGNLAYPHPLFWTIAKEYDVKVLKGIDAHSLSAFENLEKGQELVTNIEQIVSDKMIKGQYDPVVARQNNPKLQEAYKLHQEEALTYETHLVSQIINGKLASISDDQDSESLAATVGTSLNGIMQRCVDGADRKDKSIAEELSTIADSKELSNKDKKAKLERKKQVLNETNQVLANQQRTIESAKNNVVNAMNIGCESKEEYANIIIQLTEYHATKDETRKRSIENNISNFKKEKEESINAPRSSSPSKEKPKALTKATTHQTGVIDESDYANNGFANTIILTILATLAVGIIVGIIYMLYQFGIK